jgi:hypothetical protein
MLNVTETRTGVEEYESMEVDVESSGSGPQRCKFGVINFLMKFASSEFSCVPIISLDIWWNVNKCSIAYYCCGVFIMKSMVNILPLRGWARATTMTGSMTFQYVWGPCSKE